MSDSARKMYGRSKAAVILIGIALSLLGIVMFFHPIRATLLIVNIIGWTLTIVGALTLINAAIHHTQAGWQTDLAVGLAEFLPGLLILWMPGLFTAVVFELIGVIILLNGINDLIDAGIANRMGASNTALLVVLGVLTIITGVCVLLSPLMFAEFMMLIAGVSLVIDGVTEVIAGIKM